MLEFWFAGKNRKVINHTTQVSGGGGGSSIREAYDASVRGANSGDLLYFNGTKWTNVPSASLGGGLNIETPTGVVDGSNTSFTVSNEPKMVIVDGTTRTDGFGYAYLAGTITLDIPPYQFIISLY